MSWGRLPWGLRERPFDVYAAVLLFITGVYTFFTDMIPPGFDSFAITVIVNVVAVYFMASSIVILTALLKDPHKCPAFVLFGEMYGWSFVAAASLATSFMYLASLFWITPYSWLAWGSWFFVWVMLTVASSIRSIDLIAKYREMKK
jgi:hypothetical protein